jgi:hypothetical protein
VGVSARKTAGNCGSLAVGFRKLADVFRLTADNFRQIAKDFRPGICPPGFGFSPPGYVNSPLSFGARRTIAILNYTIKFTVHRQSAGKSMVLIYLSALFVIFTPPSNLCV